jgi:hypothetical protein
MESKKGDNEESGEKREKKDKKRASPAKLTRKRFKDVEKKEPKMAKKIRDRTSGDIYGLFPTPFGYSSDIVVDVYFKEGIYQYGLD